MNRFRLLRSGGYWLLINLLSIPAFLATTLLTVEFHSSGPDYMLWGFPLRFAADIGGKPPTPSGFWPSYLLLDYLVIVGALVLLSLPVVFVYAWKQKRSC